MTNADQASNRVQEGRHHFRPPDPADLVDRPADAEGAAVQGPVPPRPWYKLIAGQWPLFVSLAVVATGVAVATASYWRRGSTIVGAGFLLSALLRAVVPERAIGLLACRSRWFDAVFMLVLGVSVVALVWTVDPTGH